jgi:methionyl-tRNA formyltransferase
MYKLQNVCFIAAETMRSRAYAQVMGANGINIDQCLYLKTKINSEVSGLKYHSATLHDILIPDLSKTLDESLNLISSNIEIIKSNTINCIDVNKYIKSSCLELIIFSGFGGEIVSSSILELGVPILHLHSGWLPEYRGSTTIYYSIIEKKECAVSAILLESKIDTGPIVARKKYPLPPSDIDIDNLYDNAIRSDLLVDVLLEWNKNKSFVYNKKILNGSSKNFYVIHPILKHLAMLQLKNNA